MPLFVCVCVLHMVDRERYMMHIDCRCTMKNTILKACQWHFHCVLPRAQASCDTWTIDCKSKWKLHRFQWAAGVGSNFDSQHFSSLLLAMLVAICIPKDRVVGSAVHETQLRLGFIPFVSGLCVECLCSLECSAGWHGVSGLLLLELLVVAKVAQCSCGSLFARRLCQFPKPRLQPKQQAYVQSFVMFQSACSGANVWERWPRRWSHGRRGWSLLMCFSQIQCWKTNGMPRWPCVRKVD